MSFKSQVINSKNVDDLTNIIKTNVYKIHFIRSRCSLYRRPNNREKKSFGYAPPFVVGEQNLRQRFLPALLRKISIGHRFITGFNTFFNNVLERVTLSILMSLNICFIGFFYHLYRI